MHYPKFIKVRECNGGKSTARSQRCDSGWTRRPYSPLQATLFTDCVPHYLHSHVRIVFELYPFSVGPIVIATRIWWPVISQAVGRVKDSHCSLAPNHSHNPTIVTPVFPPLKLPNIQSFTKAKQKKNKTINCETAAGSPTGLLEMIGPF